MGTNLLPYFDTNNIIFNSLQIVSPYFYIKDAYSILLDPESEQVVLVVYQHLLTSRTWSDVNDKILDPLGSVDEASTLFLCNLGLLSLLGILPPI